MFYDIKQLPDLPVVLGTWHEGFKFAEQGPAYTLEIRALWDSLKTPVFYIIDMSELPNISLEGLLKAASSGSGSGGSLHHPMNRRTIFVSTSPVMPMVAEGLRTNAFGNANVELVGTLDEALAYVRNAISASDEAANP